MGPPQVCLCRPGRGEVPLVRRPQAEAQQQPERDRPGRQNCMKLNAADAYFDGGLVQMDRIGDFFYQSSRNNNFSNRSHKASITVIPVLSTVAIVVVAAGAVLLVAGLVTAGLVVQA